jgi:hypothetical protein
VELFDEDADGATGRWADEVEAVRAGYVLARNPKGYQQWRSSVDRVSGRRPDGKPLSQLARDFGGVGLQIVRGEFEFRN